MLVFGSLIHFVALIVPFGTPSLIQWYRSGTIDDHYTYTGLWAIIVVFLAPSLVGMFSGAVVAAKPVASFLSKYGLGFVDRMPSTWTFAFWRLKDEAVFVKIFLTSGTVTGGILGTVSTVPSQRDVFVQQVWVIRDGNFLFPALDSIGMWVRHDQIERIEFYPAE